MNGLECGRCGARVELEPRFRTGTCVYCGSPQVVERPASPDRPNPTFALPFRVTPERVKAIAKEWVRSRPFAPNAFRSAPLQNLRGIYLPTYLYSARAHSTYEAMIGENYTVTETYTTTDSQGKTVTRTRTRTETEWRPLSGHHAMYVADRVVSASRGLPNPELEAIEPFDLRELRRYDPRIVSGWATEEPSRSVQECAELARQEALAAVGADLTGFMPGDKFRGLSWNTNLDQEDSEIMLAPIWVLPIVYGEEGEVVRLLINGQTGKLFGDAPKSWWKIGALVLLVITIIAAIGLGIIYLGRPR